MVSTVVGKTTLSSAVQSANMFPETTVIPSGSRMLCRAVQPPKAPTPMLETLPGKVMLSRAVQSANTLSSKVGLPPQKVTDFKDSQPSNAPGPTV